MLKSKFLGQDFYVQIGAEHNTKIATIIVKSLQYLPLFMLTSWTSIIYTKYHSLLLSTSMTVDAMLPQIYNHLKL